MRLRRVVVGILTGLLSVLFTLAVAGEAGAQQYPPRVEAEDVRVRTNVVTVQAGRAGQAQAGRVAVQGARKGGLAKTGNASVAPLTAAGAGLVVIGAIAVTAARRRRTAQALQP